MAITSVVLPRFLVQLASPRATPSFDLLSLLAGVVYAATFLYLILFRVWRDHPTWQAWVQFSGDLLLVSALVYIFGGIASPFSTLYLVVIMVAAVLLRRRAALTVASLAWIIYALLLAALTKEWLPPILTTIGEAERSWRVSYNLAVHFVGFYAVAIFASFLAESASRAERELEASEASLADFEILHRDVVQSIPSGLLTVDLAGRVTSANRAALEILGKPEGELLAGSIADSGLFTAEAWRELVGPVGEMRTSARQETTLARGDGGAPIGYSLSALENAAGRTVGAILVFQDLSTWRRLEEELHLKDRMVAVGELAAGLAHEVGNPLAAISGSVQLLSASVASTDSERRLFDILLKESQRLDRTIKGFLRFARPRERSSERFDVARLLAEHTELLANSPERTPRHTIELALEPDSATILGDADQISQIFWNLARNALRAMPEGGKLEIRGQLAGGSYRILFGDQGRGMSLGERKHLFQPFHSLFDGGTGIGMAIVYRIVEEHGGRIAVDSEPGRGTTIAVELPVVAPARATAPVGAGEAV